MNRLFALSGLVVLVTAGASHCYVASTSTPVRA